MEWSREWSREWRSGKTFVNKSFPRPFQKTLTRGTRHERRAPKILIEEQQKTIASRVFFRESFLKGVGGTFVHKSSPISQQSFALI